MNGGDAAEQTVRLAMEGAEFTLKIAGEGAEHILALLMAALKPAPKGQKESGAKRRGRARLKAMLKQSGNQIKFYEIQGKDLKEFVATAKKYGITYCVLRQKGDENGMVEIMARAEDASRVSRILEKLQAHDLGGGTCEQTKSAKEVKAEQKATEKAAKEKRDGAVRDARRETNQTFRGKRDELQAQYLRDIGKEKPARERRQPRTRTGQLLQELMTEIAWHIPVVRALVRRREEDAAPAIEEVPAAPEHETPVAVATDSLDLPPADEGKAKPEAPAAMRKEEPAAHPPTRTERTTRESPPSAHSSPTRQRGGEIISNEQGGKPSVKADIAAEIARRRREQKSPGKPKQWGKVQQSNQPQPKKPRKKAREK